MARSAQSQAIPCSIGCASSLSACVISMHPGRGRRRRVFFLKLGTTTTWVRGLPGRRVRRADLKTWPPQLCSLRMRSWHSQGATQLHLRHALRTAPARKPASVRRVLHVRQHPLRRQLMFPRRYPPVRLNPFTTMNSLLGPGLALGCPRTCAEVLT